MNMWRMRITCWITTAAHTHNLQGVTGGTDQTSGECSLGQTIPIKPKTPISKVERLRRYWPEKRVDFFGVCVLYLSVSSYSPLLVLNSYVIVRFSASDLDNGQASKSV